MDFSTLQPIWKTILIDSIFYPNEASIIKAIPLSTQRPKVSLIWTRKNSVLSLLEVLTFCKLILQNCPKKIWLPHPTQLDFIPFGMAFGLPWFPQRSRHSYGDQVLIVYLYTPSCLIGRSQICFLVAFVPKKLKLVPIYFRSALLFKVFGCKLPFNDFFLPNHISFIDTLDATIKKLSSANFDTACITCWMIRNCRNKLLFENKPPSSKDLWAQGNQYRLEFLEVHKKTIKADLASLPK